MKRFSSIFIAFLFIATSLNSWAQIETRLATNCATKQVEVPVLVKNLEDIMSFTLKMKFNNDLLSLDTSLYHYPDFFINSNDDYRIKTSASNDTLTIEWMNTYKGINLEDGLLLSLIFSQSGSGTAEFSWIESQCRYTNITGLNIDADYFIDNPIEIPFAPEVEISFEQFTIGCRDNSENGGCKAQAEVNIVGGTSPYTYKWYDKFNQNDSIAIGLCEDAVAVVIRDAGGCSYADLFDPVIYPAINPDDVEGFEIVYTPEEVFITKPLVEFEVDPGETIIEKYEWDFGDEGEAFTQNAGHVYQEVNTFAVSLRTENIDGCDTTISVSVEVQELEFCIPNVFTPNGDGINDTWVFKIPSGEESSSSDEKSYKATGLSETEKCSGKELVYGDHFKTTELAVFNRNGNKVFDCTNCTEYWDGSGLPDGVYFYVFTWSGEYSEGKEHGNVTILGGSN